MDIVTKIKSFLNEAEIDWESVKEAGKKTAEKIHGKADMKVINDMIVKIKKMNKAKDTEDAIGILQGMLSS